MGWLVGSTCYPDHQLAYDSYFGTQVPNSGINVATDGSSAEIVYYNCSSASPTKWCRAITKWTNTGAQAGLYTSALGDPSLPTCDYSAPFFDGVNIGWGIATAMVCAYAFVLMRRAGR